MITADTILRISESQPERLFPGERASAQLEYRRLISQWHPDRCNDARAATVMAHINKLYSVALKLIEKGEWVGPSTVDIPTKTGRVGTIPYKFSFKSPVGVSYITKDSLLALVPNEREEYARNASSKIAGLKYPDAKWDAEHRRHMPTLNGFSGTSTKWVLSVARPDGFVRLRDVLAHHKGTLPAEHVAWIMSELYNIQCYLSNQRIVHCDISLDSVFIKPRIHAVMLLGDWWFARFKGEVIKTLPQRTLLYGPSAMRRTKLATTSIDLSLIRTLGRELLGDASGSSLNGNKAIPRSLVQWLNGPGIGHAVEEYKVWYKDVLQKSFGARRFVDMPVSEDDIYPLY